MSALSSEKSVSPDQNVKFSIAFANKRQDPSLGEIMNVLNLYYLFFKLYNLFTWAVN